jgi:hypothetical protein
MNFTVRPQTGRDVHVEWSRISEAYAIAPDTADQRIFAVPKPPKQANNNEFWRAEKQRR